MPGTIGTNGTNGKDAIVDYAKLADEIAKKMPAAPTLDEIIAALEKKIDDKFAALPKQPTVEQLTTAVIAKMPPFVLQYTDKDGKVVEESPFVFSKANNRFEVQIAPVHVQNFDVNSKLIDEEKYSYPGPIKLRHGVKVPATTGPST